MVGEARMGLYEGIFQASDAVCKLVYFFMEDLGICEDEAASEFESATERARDSGRLMLTDCLYRW